jgi:hypothetical protein
VAPNALVSRVSEPINHLGSAFYFTPETVAAGRTMGLDGFRFYFLGRGGVLGDVEWPVVLAAFGYFRPALVEKMWTTAKARVPARDAARAYLECARDFGRERFAALDALDAFCGAAETVVDAAMVDPSGLALFAGLAAESRPPDLPARAMQLVATLRELRGSAHLLAVVATGLTTPVAHRIRRPDALEMFGWGPDDVRAPTPDDEALLAAAEEHTDRLIAPAYATLDAAGAAALVAGVDALVAAAG